MLTWGPALFAAAFGVSCLLAGAGWRWGVPRADGRLRGDDLTARALRDGVALAVGVVGTGTILLGVGYFATMRSLAARASGADESPPVVVLTETIPAYELGGIVLVAGFALLVGAFLVPIGTELRRRFDGL